MKEKNNLPEPKCRCQCWNCAVNNHVGCESHTSLCNIQWYRIVKQLNKESEGKDGE